MGMATFDPSKSVLSSCTIRDPGETDRKRKRISEEKSRAGTGEEDRKADGRKRKDDDRVKDLEGKKEPELKRRRSAKEGSSSESEDEEVHADGRQPYPRPPTLWESHLPPHLTAVSCLHRRARAQPRNAAC